MASIPIYAMDSGTSIVHACLTSRDEKETPKGSGLEGNRGQQPHSVTVHWGAWVVHASHVLRFPRAIFWGNE